LYSLAGPAYDVQQIDQDGVLVAHWPGPLDGVTGLSTWSSSRTFPLNDGGVLVNVAAGRGVVDQHIARYSSEGVLKWASYLPAKSGGRYVAAADALGQTIALAGMVTNGASSAFITLLEPDGVERKTIAYTFQSRQTVADFVFLVSDDTVCAGGSQYVDPDPTKYSGWLACWNDALLWERSFDKPVLASRPLNEASLDVLTSTSWTTVALADGATSNRRDTGGEGFLAGSTRLIADTEGALLVDVGGNVLWKSAQAKGKTTGGITETGAAFLSDVKLAENGDTVLSRYDTNVTLTLDAVRTPTLVASALDISQASPGCQDYCAALADAGCLNDPSYSSKPECVTLCMRTSDCTAQQGALGICLKTQGSVTCRNGTDPQTSGCDAEAAAYKACKPNIP
jgi:hypothetical protein